MLTFQQTPTPFNLVRTLLERLTPTRSDARERLLNGINVLQLGCGRGAALIALAAAFPQSRFTGYDKSAEAISDATWLVRARRLDNITFRPFDEQTPPDASAFDLVLADGPVAWR
jgi:cyclopropane fatty-acyl-phospholipid synthase-like methyltransferase